MARLDLFANPGDGGGFVVDVQANALGHLSTRVVVPLLPTAEAPKPARHLNPVIAIAGQPHVLLPQFMGALSLAELGTAVGDLVRHGDGILAAVDFLLTGV